MSKSHQMNVSMLKRSGTLGRMILFGILGAACLFGPQAQATFTATIDQVGTNVVVTGSGTIDLTDLSFFQTVGGLVSGIFPQEGVLSVGGSTSGTSVDRYKGISGPAFGSGGFFLANSSSGALVGVGSLLDVPQGYVSGTSLLDTATYNNATFAKLGITPGTYTSTWGTGVHEDSFIINAVSGSVPDTGSTLMLLVIPVGLMFLARFRSRKLISEH
jgi:hypothetical protein